MIGSYDFNQRFTPGKDGISESHNFISAQNQSFFHLHVVIHVKHKHGTCMEANIKHLESNLA